MKIPRWEYLRARGTAGCLRWKVLCLPDRRVWLSGFQPEGFNKSFAELTQKEKNKISMRRMALNKLKKFIEEK